MSNHHLETQYKETDSRLWNNQYVIAQSSDARGERDRLINIVILIPINYNRKQ